MTCLKRLSALFLLVVLLSACGSSGSGTEKPKPPPASGTEIVEALSALKVRVVHGGVQLEWQLPEGAAGDIAVFREVAGSTLSLQAEPDPLVVLPAGTVSYVDETVDEGVAYRYWLKLLGAADEIRAGSPSGPVLPLPAAAGEPFVWPDGWSTTKAGAAKQGGSLRLAVSETVFLNPVAGTGINSELRNILMDDSAHLFRRDPQTGTWIPHAARAFEIIDEGERRSTIRVQLREGMHWSDGKPVTAADYLLRYELERDEAIFQAVSELAGITATAPDSYSLEFDVAETSRLSLARISSAPLPDHILGELYREGGAAAVLDAWQLTDDPGEMAWSGPWAFAGHDAAAGTVLLERNPYYGAWNVDGSGLRLPHADRLELYVDDGFVRLFLDGSIDVAQMNAVLADHVRMQLPDVEMQDLAAENSTSQYLAFSWNLASDPFLENLFRSSAFRQAISHLIDRERHVRTFFGDAATSNWSLLSAVHENWLPSRELPQFPYDPEAAVRLLGELGFSFNEDGLLEHETGRLLEFRIESNPADANTLLLQNLRQEAESIGVTIDVTFRDFEALVADTRATGPDRGLHGWMLHYTAPNVDWPFPPELYGCAGSAQSWNRNPAGECLTEWAEELDRLSHEGLYALDDEQARQIGYRIQELLAEHMPWLFTARGYLSFLWQPGVKGEHPPALMSRATKDRSLVLTWLDR